jgi:hypothetical protein
MPTVRARVRYAGTEASLPLRTLEVPGSGMQ